MTTWKKTERDGMISADQVGLTDNAKARKGVMKTVVTVKVEAEVKVNAEETTKVPIWILTIWTTCSKRV